MDIDRISIIPTSHLDLFWLGDYRNCLSRGDELIRRYLDRADESGDETFVIDTAIFAEHFLRTHPHYEPLVRRLLAEDRLEIGGAYIDRWENLVLGESIIRNIQIGRRWAKDRLGIDVRLAAHPDLPGLNAQTAQLYRQAGIDYYVTSRKIFHEGRIWRHVAPDGTAMHVLSWPVHYVFVPFAEGTMEPSAHDHFIGDRTLSHHELRERYPHGTLAMAGSAGDLTAPDTFIQRYGKDLRAYVEQYRTMFPDVEIDYAIPATVVAPYLNEHAVVEERSGTFPSVWGVAPDEEMRFFHRVRAIERDLLDAETAAVIAAAAGRPPLPASATAWRGLYGEDAFYAPNDYAPPGREFEWLWRMQVFTQDHNGGGEDGALSIFQKKVRHDRVRAYTREVLDHAVAADRMDRPLVLTSRFDSAPLLEAEPRDILLAYLRSEADADSWQMRAHPDGRESVVVSALMPDSIGLHDLRTRPIPHRIELTENADRITARSDDLTLEVDRATGASTVHDRATGLSTPIAELPYAVRELGNDVTLATDETERIDAELIVVEARDVGPLCAQVAVEWELLGVRWRELFTLWAHAGSVDLEIDVEWPALEDWQIRMPVLGAVDRAQLRYGTAFHGSGWDDIPTGAGPLQQDEVSAEDFASYREVQHWLAAYHPETTVALLTEHPAFRSVPGETSVVLLRTPASCGDRRLHWTNPGRTTWAFQVQVIPGSDPHEPARRADRRWRAPRLMFGGAAPREILHNLGDPVRVSALYLDDDGAACLRVVNQSDSTAHVQLAGELATRGGATVDLQGSVLEHLEYLDGGLPLALEPWQIRTVKFDTPSASKPEGEVSS
ncbi:hypothetical protein IM660_00480 [Ruania alkalisoli]|uniref:Glycoside hydrolase family 38 N-terminal domain-containing protein n=1 Tax=Ruania alkalisoli TaxID=2779775 RepID=A0A7M1SV48_9MICO|nr:hypothetical protein [Ruania alkalisoli]QOR70834.1 hypothetical protein IM660_00480 [Ruania alkalisoli]